MHSAAAIGGPHPGGRSPFSTPPREFVSVLTGPSRGEQLPPRWLGGEPRCKPDPNPRRTCSSTHLAYDWRIGDRPTRMGRRRSLLVLMAARTDASCLVTMPSFL